MHEFLLKFLHKFLFSVIPLGCNPVIPLKIIPLPVFSKTASDISIEIPWRVPIAIPPGTPYENPLKLSKRIPSGIFHFPSRHFCGCVVACIQNIRERTKIKFILEYTLQAFFKDFQKGFSLFY